MPLAQRRAGITLVEVLVTIAIVVVLLGLLLPAVTAARSAARKARCSSQLKQLVMAVQGHHQRFERLPPYWGVEKTDSPKFGGWLLHILPDLGQQDVYDSWPESNASATIHHYRSVPTGKILPGVPPSPDYVPGTWKTTKVGDADVRGTLIPIYRTELVGRRGTPGYPPRPEYTSVVDSTTIVSVNTGFVASSGIKQQNASFPLLQCLEDPGAAPPGAMVPVKNEAWKDPSTNQHTVWALTNYVANAHAFVKFGQRFTLQNTRSGGTYGPSFALYQGLFFPAQAWSTGGSFNNSIASTCGIQSRRNEHILDGLSNTIMFGETMRQCDGGNVYRVAFLPVGYQTHEHAFGIEPSYPDVKTSTTIYPGSALGRTFGHTLMFQTQPGMRDCNGMRTQAVHGPFLLVAMCDGSVRAISSTVSRKEAIGANATGRDGFCRFGGPDMAINTINNPNPSADPGFWTPESRLLGNDNGVQFERPDGIWDLLMMPIDPPWAATSSGPAIPQVLSNTGEAGREK